MVASIHESCATCKRFSPTPPRPVVSLPKASDFGEVIKLDLKEVKVGQFRIVAIGEAEEQIGAPKSKEEQKILARQASALEPMVEPIPGKEKELLELMVELESGREKEPLEPMLELEPGREEEPRAKVVQPAAGEDGVQAKVRQQEEQHPKQQAEVPGEQAYVPVQQADVPVQLLTIAASKGWLIKSDDLRTLIYKGSRSIEKSIWSRLWRRGGQGWSGCSARPCTA